MKCKTFFKTYTFIILLLTQNYHVFSQTNDCDICKILKENFKKIINLETENKLDSLEYLYKPIINNTEYCYQKEKDTIYLSMLLKSYKYLNKKYTENKNIDSLILVIKNKLNFLKNLTENYQHKLIIGELLLDLGITYGKLKKINEALQSFKHLYNISEKDSTLKEKYFYQASYFLGITYYYKLNYDSSIYFYNITLDYFLKKDSIKYKSEISNILYYIGISYLELGDYDKSIQYRERALDFHIRNVDSLSNNVGFYYNGLGVIYNYKNQLNKSLEYYEKALKIFRKNEGDNSTVVAMVLNNMGIIYNNIGEYEKANLYLNKALSIRKNLLEATNDEIADTYVNIGSMYYNIKEYEKSIHYQNLALDIYYKNHGEFHPYTASTYNNIANALCMINKFDESIEMYNKTINIYNKIYGVYHPAYINLLTNIAATYSYFSKNNEAMIFLDSAMKITQKIFPEKNNYYKTLIHYKKGELLHKIANLTQEPNKKEKLLIESIYEFHNSIISNSQSFNDTDIFNNQRTIDFMDVLYAIKSYHGKAKSFEMLLKHYNENKKITKNSQEKILSNILHLYKICDYLLEITRKRIKYENDKLKFSELADEIYTHFIEFFSNKDILNSFNWTKKYLLVFSEKNKARILIENIDEKKQLENSGIPQKIKDQIDYYIDEITYLEKKIIETSDSLQKSRLFNKLFDSRQKLDSLAELIKEKYLNNSLSENNVDLLEELEKLNISDDFAFIEYTITDSTIIQIIITKNEIITNKNKYQNVKDLILNYRNALTNFNESELKMLASLSYKLYKELMLDKIPPTIKKIMIIPDKYLTMLPFETIITEPFDTIITFSNIGKMKYLIKKYEISYNYSIVLNEIITKNSNQTPSKNLLAIAPVFDKNVKGYFPDKQKAEKIEETEKEVKSIEKIFKKHNYKTEIVLREKATENWFKSEKLEKYKIIHIATHGYVDIEKPLQSGIMFCSDTTIDQNSKEDGFLYHGELFTKKLNADLVVLSACETGLGKINRGEGLIGLSRTFLMIGCKNLIVSLWPVSDASTAILMTKFYQYYLSTNQDFFTSSLRNAKIKLINSPFYAHPFFWSPFILIGK